MNKVASSTLCLVSLFLLGSSSQCSDPPSSKPTYRSSDLELLQNAQEMRIYLIRPTKQEQKANAFHGYPIISEVNFTSTESKQVLAECLRQAIGFGYSQQACFVPHHAIRATIDGRNRDFVVCFECCEAREFVDGSDEPIKSYTVSPYYGVMLNVMVASKNPLALEKARIVAYSATKNIKAGENIASLDLQRVEKWKDELTGGEIESIDFHRMPKALKSIEESQLLRSDDFCYQH